MSVRAFPPLAAAPRAADSLLAGHAPVPIAVVALVLAAGLLPGLVGHEPWKPDEAYVFGGVQHLLATGDAVVPHAGGEPFVEKPPLYHWTAALFARCLGGLLPLHDAARLASGFFMAIAVAATASAARLLWGPGRGRIAALLLAGSLALFGNAQLMIADLPLLAGFALAGLGLAAAARERAWAGLALGAGIGVGFLAKGVLAPAALGLAAIALPLAAPGLRTRTYARQLAVAVAVALPALALWPWLLFERSPALFREWFWENNIGRFVGFSVPRLGAATEPGFYAKAVLWALFPAWLFALGALAGRRASRLAGRAALAAAMLPALVLATALFASASARVVYLLPLLPSVAVLGASLDGLLVRRLDGYLLAAGALVGAAGAFVAWSAWASLAFHGAAPPWAWVRAHLPAEYALRVDPAAVAAALALTAGFAALVLRAARWTGGGLAAWAGGVATAWALAMTLLLPWIDEAKSYRGVFAAMAAQVPADAECLATQDVGESERSMLAYYTALKMRAARSPASAACRALLIQAKVHGKPAAAPPPGWRHAWTGARPAERSERFELYLR